MRDRVITEEMRVIERAAVWRLVGKTPLVRLTRLEPKPGVELHAKLESRNPGGSVKDRAAASMLLDGLRSGALRPGRTILDSTSGNTGIAYAMLGASLGYPVKLCVPANVTRERRQLLKAYGAQVVWTDPMDGSDGAIKEVRRIYQSDPDAYFYVDQYSNPNNWRAHFETTGREILEQSNERLTHFVAGLGTSGTFMGTGRRLRAVKPDVQLISVQPDSPLHGLEGLKHMDTAIVPSIYDPALADEDLRIGTEEAWIMMQRVAREEGILAGVSGGAALVAARQVASRLDEGYVVVIIPDSGERYLSDPMIGEEEDTDAARRFGGRQPARA